MFSHSTQTAVFVAFVSVVGYFLFVKPDPTMAQLCTTQVHQNGMKEGRFGLKSRQGFHSS
jgi:hypothetical protein